MQLRNYAASGVSVVVLIAGTGWALLHAQATSGAAQPAPRPRTEKQLLYVTVPGTIYAREDVAGYGGVGVVVFDAKNKFKFIKRFPTWDISASQDPGRVTGVVASPVTGLLYIATLERLGAFDLITEKKVWEETYGGQCCDRMAISPDGKILYVPPLGGSGPRDFWFVVDAKTGKLITKVATPDTAGAHNTVYSVDGSRVFMAGTRSKIVSVADAKTHTVVQKVGPFGDNVRPFTINGRGTLIFVNTDSVLGFEIGDVRTGKVIHRVDVAGHSWSKDREVVPGRKGPLHNSPSHGVAMSPDEKEIWVADTSQPYVHIFDSTVMPPKQKMSIPLRFIPGWITFGLDGKYVYPSSGDVIDAATKKIVAGLKDEFGNLIQSEKMVEVAFADGKPTRAVDQFGVGMVTTGSN